MNDLNPYAAPLAAAEPVGLQPTLFSFSGRIPRRTYWLVRIGIVLVNAIVTTIVGRLLASLPAIRIAIAIAAIIVFYWVGLATAVKRWHDRDKSGWWELILLIPLVGAIWVFVELGCLRGTVGPNHFGPDPT